jgi:NADH:ubiquinone oxidoreductase subunit 6 (subunit J)/rubrerythrin
MNGLLEWVIFIALSAVAVITATGMILTMSMYRAGLALMASFVALAGLFILLDADLMAAIQIMMNVGGMLVMVLFMVMMMMDPGGEMMWGMKRDMHMPGPGAFSMHMPRGEPPEDEPPKGKTGASTDWTCPMHPEVSQPNAGNCPKCGMALLPCAEVGNGQNEQESTTQATVYICPMHPEIQQASPGNCPKCGMTLLPQTDIEDGQEEQQSTSQTTLYTCPMHPEVRQSNPGNCPKCGMTLLPVNDTTEDMSHMAMPDHNMNMSMSDGEMDMSGHDMNMSNSEMDMSGHDMNMSGHDMSMSSGGMNMSGHDMNMSGMTMTPRQNYQMMVDMAMSTAQLPWAIALGIASALLLIVLIVQTPWPLAQGGPTQDATTAVGELLLSRYMIGFEGAAFLILAGIAGAVLFGKRERTTAPQKAEQQATQETIEAEASDTTGSEQQLYTCPMHPEIRQTQPGNCPKCGMPLIPVEEKVPTSKHSQHQQGGHS